MADNRVLSKTKMPRARVCRERRLCCFIIVTQSAAHVSRDKAQGTVSWAISQAFQCCVCFRRMRMTNEWKMSVRNRSAKQPMPRQHSVLVVIILLALGFPPGSGLAHATDVSSIRNAVRPAAAGLRTSRSPTDLHASQTPIIFPNVPPPPKLPDIRSYILLDAKTGAIIAQKSPNLRSQPASLAKLMTAYLTYQAVA